MSFMRPTHVAFAATLTLSALAASAQTYTFRHYAGYPSGPGYSDGNAAADVRFDGPQGIAISPDGIVYVADYSNYVIRRIDPDGVVSTLAGMPGSSGISPGSGSAARVGAPTGLAVGSDGMIYCATGYEIIKITPAGLVSRLAGSGYQGTEDGVGTAARFMGPSGVAVDGNNYVYVTDYMSYTIRRVAPDGTVTTIAGLAGSSGTADGTGSAARFNSPYGITYAPDGNLYINDHRANTVRRMTPAGVVSTVAGSAFSSGSTDATGTAARFSTLRGITADAAGNLWICDTGNYTLRKMTPAGTVSTVAGVPGSEGFVDGPLGASRLSFLNSVAAAANGDVYFTDSINNHTVRRLRDGVVTTIVGTPSPIGTANGTGRSARFNRPNAAIADASGNIFISEQDNHCIRKIAPGGVVTPFAGLCGTSGSTNGTGDGARFTYPVGMAFDTFGNLYVAESGNCVIRHITPAGVVTTFSGLVGNCSSVDGSAALARFNRPRDVAFDAAGDLFVSESSGNRIRRISAVDGSVSTFAGSGVAGGADGTGTLAQLNNPEGLVFDASGNLYVAESRAHRIRKITALADVTTLAGTGSVGSRDGTGVYASFWAPRGLAIDPAGYLWVADSDNNNLRRIDLTTRAVITAAGQSRKGCREGTGTDARFNLPVDVTFDSSGRMYVVEMLNHAIRTGDLVLDDIATVDFPSGSMGVPRQLDTAPQAASSWNWRVIRRPGGSKVSVSDPVIRNPAFTPDVDDLYTFEVAAHNSSNARISRVDFTGSCVTPAAPEVTSSKPLSCRGEAVTLTASAGYTSYLWSNGARTQSITVTPLVTTSYSVAGYRGTCLSNTAPITQNVLSISAPTGVTASATQANQVELGWTLSADPIVDHYNIYRSPKLCAGATSYVKIGSTPGGTFTDMTVHAGESYSYKLTAANADDSCESDHSVCDDAVAYGACALKPTFAGLISTTVRGCILRLTWPAATSNCPNDSSIAYNIYRSASSIFTPSDSSRIARCVTMTLFDDGSAPAGTNYYVVRAEDATSGNGGACNGGNEDENLVQRSGAPSTAIEYAPLFSDTFDSGGRPANPETYWTESPAEPNAIALSTCRGSTAYRLGATTCAADYANLANETLTLGPSSGFTLPAASSIRLRFTKAYELENNWDGVALYYKTELMGDYVRVAETAAPDAPYLTAGFYTGTASSQASQRVWTGIALSTFTESIVNLDALAGRQVWFQWRFTSDSSVVYDGFYLDNAVIESGSALSCATVPEPLYAASATSTDASTRIEFLTPSTNYNSTVARFRTDGTFPASATDGFSAGAVAGSANGYGSITHSSLTNDTTYFYSLFVNNAAGQWSPVRLIRSRPQVTSGPVKWVYNTGASAMTPPGLFGGAAGSTFVASNDRVFHGVAKGASGGTWPAAWLPSVMNGPSQSRTLPLTLPINGVNRNVVLLGSQDGHAYCVDAASGALIWSSPELGDMVQGSPTAISAVYGAPFSLVFAASRTSDGASKLYALHPDNGAVVWTFDNGAAQGGDGAPIGVINDALIFTYATFSSGKRRAYFGSRRHASGSQNTLWAVEFDATSVTKLWATNVGDIDGFPFPANDRLYVGTTSGKVQSIRASDGLSLWSAPLETNDGGVKVTVWPDPANERLYFSTTNYVWAAGTDGSIKWQKALASPSNPNRYNGTLLVGAGDGSLYQLGNLLVTDPALLEVKSITLGDPATPGYVGDTTIDRATGMIYVGTGSGAVYAVTYPLP